MIRIDTNTDVADFVLSIEFAENPTYPSLGEHVVVDGETYLIFKVEWNYDNSRIVVYGKQTKE